jgi:hypothetical protein
LDQSRTPFSYPDIITPVEIEKPPTSDIGVGTADFKFPSTGFLARPSVLLSIAPDYDPSQISDIPPSVRKRVDRFMNPATRKRRPVEPVDEVAGTISKMIASGSAGPTDQARRFRNAYQAMIDHENPMPVIAPRYRLRVGGAMCIDAKPSVEEPEPPEAKRHRDNYSDAEYYSYIDPEGEVELFENSESYEPSSSSTPSERPRRKLKAEETKTPARRIVDEPKKLKVGEPGIAEKPKPDGKKKEGEKDPGECSMASLGPESETEPELLAPDDTLLAKVGSNSETLFAKSSSGGSMKKVDFASSDSNPKRAGDSF